MFRRHSSSARGEHRGGDSGAETRVELPRRVVDVPMGPSVQSAHGGPPIGRVAVGGETGPVLLHGGGPSRAETGNERELVVGAGIELKGEVKGCRRLVVHGDAQVTVEATDALVVGADGTFRGACEVESAEIAGRFDGTLTVRGRLLVRATGCVKGEVRFGELEIERGGQLSGNIDGHSRGPQLATVAAAGGT